MKEVFKSLYIGSDDDVPKAREKGFAIVHAEKDGLYSHRSLLKYEGMSAPKGPEYLVVKRGKEIYLNLVDTDDPNFIPSEAVNAALEFIKENLNKNQPILVHCNAGLSRSPSLVFMYLYSVGKLPHEYHKALQMFRKLYPDYDPALGIQIYAKRRILDFKNLR